MNKKTTIYYLCFLMILLTYNLMEECSAQSDSAIFQSLPEEFWSEQLEEFAGEEAEVDLSELIESSRFSVEEKIDINRLSPEVALQILQLTEKQYYQLQLYIEEYGELLTLYELLAVESFTEADLQRLLPYFTIEKAPPKKGFRKVFYNPKQEVLFRYEQVLEEKIGYDTTRTNYYLGSPSRLIFRYKYQTKHLSIALAGEKDAGEQFFGETQKQGFDHYAFNLILKDLGILKSVVLGSYRLNFGQGLIAGGGLLGGKGGAAKTVRKFSTGIQPTAPMNESDYLCGVAVAIGNNRYKGTLFYGYRHFDGEVKEKGDERFFGGTLSVNGYHRTPKELEKKRQLMQNLYGGNFRYNGAVLQIGVQALYSHFSAEILPNGDFYRLFDFTGKSCYNIGIDYQLLIRKNILFGEAAYSKNSGWALLQGAILQPDPKVNIGLLFRYYSPKYIASMSGAFGEGSKVRNETGLYLSTDIILGGKSTLSFYADFFRFLWLRYQVDKPTSGMELSAKWRREIAGNAKIEWLYGYKKQEKNGTTNPYFKEITTRHRHKCRTTFLYNPFSRLQLKTEIDFIFNAVEDVSSRQRGILIFQDVSLSFPRANLETKCRVAFFDTDSYEERLYAYEQDLIYSFNITGYYYQGWRSYLMFKYRILFIDLSLRVSYTYYINKKEIGSGLELINEPHKTDIKAQIVIKIPNRGRKRV